MDLSGEVHGLSLVDLKVASPEIVEQVRKIRNQEPVRKNMYTTHEITESEHLKWVASLRQSDSSKFFAVIRGDKVVGGAGISGINTPHRRADWAYYLSSDAQGRGTGSALEFKFLDFVFASFGIFKLNCEVIDWNSAVVKLHKRFGFKDEGLRRAHVWREGSPHDVVLLGLTADEWKSARSDLTQGLFKGL